jgi:hypothetical protein
MADHNESAANQMTPKLQYLSRRCDGDCDVRSGELRDTTRLLVASLVTQDEARFCTFLDELLHHHKCGTQ